MTLQIVIASCFGGGDYLGVQLLVTGYEGDIHEGAELFVHGAGEHLGGIQEIVHHLGLVDVPPFHLLQAADALKVLEDLAAAVDCPAVGGVVHGAIVSVGLIAHVNGRLGVQLCTVANQVLPDDGHHHASRTHVLLHAGVNHAVIGNVAGAGQEHGTLVADQQVPLGVGQLVPGYAVNGFVLADVHIVRVFGNVQIIAVGDVAEVAVLAGGHHVYVTVLFRFGNRFLGPRAGLHIAGHAVFHQVHGDHGELKCCAALDEQHFVVVRDVHQVPQILLGLVDDLLEDRGAVAHLHDAHSGAPVVHHFVPDLLQDRFRHGGGTGREIENAIVHKRNLLHVGSWAVPRR